MDPNYQNLRHNVLSPVFSAFSHEIHIPFRSSSMVALQLFQGLPLFYLFSFWRPFHRLRSESVVFILCTWRSHLAWFILKFSSILSIPVLCLTSSFVILCFQVIPNILLNQPLMMRSIQFCDCHGPCFTSIFQGCLHKRLIQPDSDIYLFIEIKWQHT